MKGCIGYSIRVHLTRLRCSASLSWPAAWNPAIRKGTRDSIGDLHRSPNRCNVNVLMSSLHPLRPSRKKKSMSAKVDSIFLRCCVMLTSAVPFHIVGRATKPPRRSSGTAVVPCGGTWLSTSPRQIKPFNWQNLFHNLPKRIESRPRSEESPGRHRFIMVGPFGSYRIIFGPYSNPFHVHYVGSTGSIRKWSSLCSRNIWPVFKWIENIGPVRSLPIHAKSKFNLSLLSTMQRALGTYRHTACKNQSYPNSPRSQTDTLSWLTMRAGGSSNIFL